MKKTFKYRIYPTRAQGEALRHIFWFCRFLYNSALEERIRHYKCFNKGQSYNKQANQLPAIKGIFASETANIHSQILQQVLKQLDKSYQNFFRRLQEGTGEAGFPRFKGQNRFRSICFPQPDPELSGSCVKLLSNNKLKISGLPGEIKVKWHRPLQGRCKQVRIVKQADKYYICFSCDEVPKKPLASTGKTIGIDLGLTTFITSDDGTKFHHPKPYKTAKEKLAYLNQKLARKKRGSNNRKKTLVALQRAHHRIHNVREDFQHKVAKQLLVENDTVILEKLNVKDMLQEKGYEVNKQNISDASWSAFAAKLSYKAESADKKVVFVDPRNTSKKCSGCGNVKSSLTLRDRTYHCDACGIAIDRDINAALNIKRLGTSLAA